MTISSKSKLKQKLLFSELLKHFKIYDDPPTKIKQSVISNYTVIIGDKEYSLKDYIKRQNIPMSMINILLYNIDNNYGYLKRFYNKSLEYNSVELTIKESPMKNNEFDNNKNVQYKNIIRNMFYLEILKNTTSGMKNHPSFLNVLENLYINSKIDYKLLTPSALYYIKENRIGSVFSSFYFRASIMNPYLVYSINHNLLHGKRIFTPTLGWGSYLYGFAESNIIEYVGIDIIPRVCSRLSEFTEQCYPKLKTEFLCIPSEKLLQNILFMKKYKSHFDTIFFSPPYFDLEKYSGELQSIKQYPVYTLWLQEYWKKTIDVCLHVLKRGGYMCYILSDYGPDNNKYNLVEDMNNIVLRNNEFSLKQIQSMNNKNVNSTKHRKTDEKIMLFVKN